MGKSDANQTKKRAHKAKATDGEIKHNNKPSFDAAIFEATDNEEGIRQSQWRDQFRQLCEYKVEFGDCLVQQRYSANPKLGKWVSMQRRRYRKKRDGKSSAMTDEHIRALDGIGFDWDARKTDVASSWSVHFQQLCEFKLQFGHYLLPVKHSDNPKLGKWISNQRAQYKLHQVGKPSRMTVERIRELESIEFNWEQVHLTWDEQFEQLCEYKLQFGDCLVPKRYSVNPKLGRWVSTQRTRYRKYMEEEKYTLMTAEYIQALNGIGFDWGTSKTDLASIWSVRFQQLCEFKVQFGDCVVPAKYSDNPKLGNWCSNQRAQYRLHQEGKPSRMTAQRNRELESIGFKWEQIHLTWDKQFEQLREYKLQFGDCVVPAKYSANLQLGRWVQTQRHDIELYQEGKPSRMTAQRNRELESIGFK